MHLREVKRFVLGYLSTVLARAERAAPGGVSFWSDQYVPHVVLNTFDPPNRVSTIILILQVRKLRLKNLCKVIILETDGRGI